MQELSDKDALTAKIVSSYQKAAQHLDPWSKISIRAFFIWGFASCDTIGHVYRE